MKKAVLFDLDGTLWDSADGVCTAWNIVLERCGMVPELTVDWVHGVMGVQMDAIAARLFPGRSRVEQAALMDECCAVEHELLGREGGVLFPDLEAMLKELAGKYTLAVVSNCQSGYIETFFAAHGLGKYFSDKECFGNTGLSKGENIALVISRGAIDRAVYLGDTQGDFESAAWAGVPFIHAAYGFGRADGAKYSISSLSELSDMAARLLD